MSADADFVLLFPPARARAVLDALAAAAECPDDASIQDGCAVLFSLPATPELTAILARWDSVGAIVRDGRALVGDIIVWHRVTDAPFGGSAVGPVFEVVLWPVTTRLWQICVEAAEVRSLLVGLLERFDGLEGWIDRGDGSGERFWP